ncbi:GPI-ANCHORED ADHESIN-LIKE PROTEIN, partial [Salix purpurea]
MKMLPSYCDVKFILWLNPTLLYIKCCIIWNLPGFFCLLFAICALVAALSAGDQGIISLAFGCTRLFQPDKPVTKAQVVVALATGEASDT